MDLQEKWNLGIYFIISTKILNRNFRNFLNGKRFKSSFCYRSGKNEKINILLNSAIILSVVILLAIIDDFLCLHDIQKDYISQSALTYHETGTTKTLPDWTNTKLEWLSVTVSWFVKFVLSISNLIILFVLKRNYQNNSKTA